MKFRYITETLRANGSTETSATDFDVSELQIGRGGSSQIIIPGRLISLVHAQITEEAGRVFITDKGSISGTKLNGERINRAELRSGDEVQLGETKVSISFENGTCVLKRSVTDHEAPSREALVASTLKAIEFSNYIPSLRTLSLIALIISGGVFLVLPLLGKFRTSWSSGPLANVHHIIETDCTACHSSPFQHVQDKQCITCHSLTEHAPGFVHAMEKHPEANMRCAQCHMDHNGDDGLTLADARLCTNCHANIDKIYSDADALKVATWDTHPQFRIPVEITRGTVERISLDEKDKAIDQTHIKLNHSIHLRAGLRGKNGPVTLTCGDCHKLSKDYTTIEPISFDKNCRDCHSLGFDDRLPNVEVPHGDDAAIYPALFTEYTKLLLMDGGKQYPGAIEQPERMKPGGTGMPKAEAPVINTELVVAEARKAETELFTKTACFLCHDSNALPAYQQTATNSHFQVTHPEIPNIWFTSTRFNHGSHEEIACESCHTGVRQSHKTSDVLLPKISDCKECHSQHNKTGFVQSECVMCHSYHDSLPLPPESKKTIGDYVTVIKREK